MLQTKKLSVSAVLLALVLAITMMAGDAGAVYVGDGSKQNGITGGWDVTDYGVCVTGIKSDGTMVIDATKTSRADCITATFPLLTTSAACIGDSDANGGSHYWTNTCVDALGNGISLAGLDRNKNMCAQKGGTWKSACTSAWVFTGPAGDGAPGFCYAKIQLTGAGYTQETCPTSSQGYTWDAVTGTCDFAYGIAGYLDANNVKKNGTAGPVAGSFVDLSGYTSQGLCLYDGFGWSTGTTKSGTSSVATTPNPSTVAVITGARAGCLECHNNTTQYNSYAERWKTDYLSTGHKNMLRKVAPGMNWAGPEGIYTVDGSGNSINFVDGTVNVGGTDRKLFYLYGDWMAPEPTSVYNTNGDGVTSNGYSCASCHTTGWSNPTKGVCYPDSTKTTAATCVSPNTWVASAGVEGTVGAEPQASFPGITGITGYWDIDGITCTRCHAVTVPAVPGKTTTHETDNLDGASVNNTCFGCHQSLATTYVAQNIGGINYPANAKILDPAMIPTGTSHGSVWGREFNGHVLGNSFLNSPHSRFTGTVAPNVLGKYDIAGGTYDSYFASSFCRANNSDGTPRADGGILTTKVDGSKIVNSADCAAAGGTWWPNQDRGSCSTCHDVHQSIVPAVGAHEPLRRECNTCHGTSLTALRHPAGAGTPLAEMASKPSKPCEVCHMPKSTDEGLPMHLWRINTSASYDTFPSRASFYGGSCSVDEATLVSEATCTNGGGAWTPTTKDRRANTAPDGAYANAVWVDVDTACGQCHGGGANSTDNPPVLGVPYYSKTALSSLASNMHYSSLDAQFIWAADGAISYQVNFAAASGSCSGPEGSTCTYAWDFGDGATATGEMVSHVYADATTVTATLTMTNTTTGTTGSTSQSVTPVVVNTPPVASKSANLVTGMTVSFTDMSTDAQDAQSALVVTVLWGDGQSSTGAGGSAFSHTYALAGTYTVRHSVKDTGGLTNSSLNSRVYITAKYSISGSIMDGSAAPVAGASVYLKQGSTVKRTTTTAADGTYSFSNLLNGCYIVQPAKAGSTFSPVSQTVCVGPSKTAIDFTAAP